LDRRIIYIVIPSLFLIISYCGTNKKDEKVKTLTFSVAEKIPVTEPSGLVLSADEKAFWTVSDQTAEVYLFDGWGKIIKSFKLDGEDPEGITIVEDSTLAVVLERSREIIILDTAGNEIKRASINLKGDLNSGLEGITYDPAEKKFYLINEKNPLLLITLDQNLVEIKRDTLNFSKDVSGIFYDSELKVLWILSDENQRIYKTDFSGNPIEEFRIKVTQPEGIAFNKARARLYIISDRTENLYVFNLK
jgi:uncharacterized protein YjiK